MSERYWLEVKQVALTRDQVNDALRAWLVANDRLDPERVSRVYFSVFGDGAATLVGIAEPSTASTVFPREKNGRCSDRNCNDDDCPRAATHPAGEQAADGDDE